MEILVLLVEVGMGLIIVLVMNCKGQKKYKDKVVLAVTVAVEVVTCWL